MISKYYGKSYSVQFLRKKIYLSPAGASLTDISDAAEEIGFHSIGVRVTLDQLINEAPLPCIAHWNGRHYVVINQVKGNKIHLADPSYGQTAYTKEEFCKQWLHPGKDTGVVLLLEPTPKFYEEAEDATVPAKNTVVALLGHLWKYKKYLFQLFLGLLMGSLLQLSLPFLTQAIVDVGINTRNLNFVHLILAGQLTLFASRTAVDLIRRWILLHLSARINIALISDFLVKITRLPLSYFSQNQVGEILQRINDYGKIERFLSTTTLNVLFSIISVLIYGAVLAFYDAQIFLIFLASSIVYIIYVSLFIKKRREIDFKQFSAASANQDCLIQLINGMPEIKLNNCEKQKRWEWENIQAKLFKLNMSSTKLAQYQHAGSFIINEVKNIFITFLSAKAVIDGEITLGMMLAIQYIIGQLNGPVDEFVEFTRTYQEANNSMERIGEVYNYENEDSNNGNYSNLMTDALSGQSIKIENLSFHYAGPNSPRVLQEVSMAIPAGKVTAIVGTSGSGKTTLLKLLLKFYSNYTGDIKAGEYNLASVKGSAWRQKCGVVMQDGFIFVDTVANNIAMTADEVDFKKLKYAAKIANIEELIDSLPQRYDTKIMPSSLSQGQKQRILIARAIYKDPEYLFFDEATSSLDANNEKVIMENLDEFFRGRTVIVIAHRLSTVRNADQIVVLEKGRVIETGTHNKLIKDNGQYFHLVKNQLELGN
jgi:ATP-binding cassette subfamily B protein